MSVGSEQIWLMLVEVSSKSAEVGPDLAKIRPKSGRLNEVGPESIGPCPANLVRIRPDSARLRPIWARIRPKAGDSRLRACPLWGAGLWTEIGVNSPDWGKYIDVEGPEIVFCAEGGKDEMPRPTPTGSRLKRPSDTPRPRKRRPTRPA